MKRHAIVLPIVMAIILLTAQPIMGYISPCGCISGKKFEDVNKDGDRDLNEPWLQGWTIELYDNSGHLLKTTITNSNGYYSFNNLPPGTYVVKEVQKDGWEQTYPSNGGSHAIIINENSATNKNFGNHKIPPPPPPTPPPTLIDGRMTGGGSIINGLLRVTHGFELHCDASKTPNNLEINWNGNKFHLENLITALCSDDPTIEPNPPSAGFDTYKGEGSGRYNGVSGASAHWTFTDAGEPGRKDFAKIEIWDNNDNLILSVSGNLRNGNQQAHAN